MRGERMLKKWLVTTGVLMFFLVAAVPGFSSDQKPVNPADKTGGAQNQVAPAGGMVLIVNDPRSSTTVTVPLDSTAHDDLPVAVVNDVPITVEDLKSTIAAAHEEGHEEGDEGKKDRPTHAPIIDFNELLQRLINVQLVIQEAKSIGLDELPEVKGPIDIFSNVSLRSLLREDVAKDVTASEDEVEKVYRENIREVKTNTAVFEKEKDAKKAAREIKAGKSFDDVIAKGKKARTVKTTEFGINTIFKDLDPAVAKALSTMKVGSISPVTKTLRDGKTHYFFFQLADDRLLESPEAKEQARQTVLQIKIDKAMETLRESLYKKYVKVDKKLVESLDYGPKGEGLEKLLEDQRVAVEIEGDQPVTVAQLSQAMQEKFYHGMKNLNGEKLIKAKHDALESLIEKRLFILEARKRGLDKTAAYKNMVEEYERGMLWGAFIQKVVARDVKLRDEDLRAYYHDHAGDYQSAKMVKIRSLKFGKEADAIASLEKLRKGADFNWIKTNVEGQLDTSTEDEDLMISGDQLVPINAIKPDVQKALSGVNAEDFRLYESPQGHFYVLYITEMAPPQQQPFEVVAQAVRNKVFFIKLNEAVNEWIRKLKESADIKIYLAGSEK
jgi:hypothetical protein